MSKLVVFNQISLDGYFTDARNDMSWAHKQDAEWNAFAAENAKRGGMLLFGRVTYEMMASHWPTPAGRQSNPTVAEHMNAMPKIVFSRTLDKPTWQNTRLIKGGIAAEVRKLKQEAGPDMVILGSGSIVAQLTDARLIDEYQLVVNAIALGAGRTLFDNIERRLELKLRKTQAFGNGNVVLWYEPAASGE